MYRVRVEGYQFRLPALRDSLVVNSAPTPLGGWDFERMRSKAVSPVAWGSETPFAYSDPVGAGPTPFERLQGLVAKAVKAHADDNNARARAEVQQELAEVAAHNARVAAGLSGDEGDAKKTNEKGKQVDKKKRTGRR